MKKKLLSSALSLTMLGVTLSLPMVSAQTVSPRPGSTINESAPIDINLIPEERLVDALKTRGIISENATSEQAKQAVKEYVNKKSKKGTADASDSGQDSNGYTSQGSQSAAEKSDVEKKKKKFLTEQKEKFKEDREKYEKVSEKDSEDESTLTKAKDKPYNGPVRKDKVLVLLVDFADYKHNNIQQTPGYMYAKDFNRQHYQDMMFGDKEFELFNGDKVQTFKQYYEEQSGGSYTVDGYVSDWLTVPGNARAYGDDDPNGGHDNMAPKGPRDLVKDALLAAAASGVNLVDFDQYDQYDIDGDGNLNEPDGLVDHLMVIHAGTGQEAGGGQLGDDAIWSHRWNLGRVFTVPNTNAKVDYWGGKMAAFDYTIEPEDGAAGVFAHEFGHDLGLPDEYDTIYSGDGEPVGVWSIMSGGSWAGHIAGTQPTSFSPQNKLFFQTVMGGNWANIKEVNYSDLSKKGIGTILTQSVSKTSHPGIVKVDLPDKAVQGIPPAFGQKYYYSTKGDDLHTVMTSPVFDLTNATNATFSYKTNYKIEYDYDFLYVDVLDENGQILQEIDKLGDENTNNGADSTNGQWVDKAYDLSAFKGQKIKLQFSYVTDGGLAYDGFLLDNAQLTADGTTVFSDDAEGAPQFTLDGFIQSNGISYAKNYYLLEWRNYAGADTALLYARGAKYNTGLLVWYADDSFNDNWVGMHPGEGFLGVVDSHPHDVLYFDSNGTKTTKNSTRYQIADAAFSHEETPEWSYQHKSWGYIEADEHKGVTLFNDKNSYMDDRVPQAGRLIPKLGLEFKVLKEAEDSSAGLIKIQR